MLLSVIFSQVEISTGNRSRQPDVKIFDHIMIISRMTVDEIEKWHERRFKLFAEDDRCDLLGCETITGSKEVEALLR